MVLEHFLQFLDVVPASPFSFIFFALDNLIKFEISVYFELLDDFLDNFNGAVVAEAFLDDLCQDSFLHFDAG